ncbi:MAG: hypothetical protein P8Y39_09750 [Nitrospirota bacterium]|jgi:hypothetical protein
MKALVPLLLLFLLLFSSIAPAGETDWVSLGGGVSYDGEGVKRTEGGLLRVRVKTALRAGYNITLNEIDCTEKTLRVLTITLYSRTGAPVAEALHSGEEIPIAPGSVMDDLRERVCR